jgi:hypothetical protein
VVRRDQSFWQSQWRRLKRMMFEVSAECSQSPGVSSGAAGRHFRMVGAVGMVAAVNGM